MPGAYQVRLQSTISIINKDISVFHTQTKDDVFQVWHLVSNILTDLLSCLHHQISKSFMLVVTMAFFHCVHHYIEVM